MDHEGAMVAHEDDAERFAGELCAGDGGAIDVGE